MKSFGFVTCICNGRRLSPSSIGVVSWSVWFDVLDDVEDCVVEEAADVFGCDVFDVVVGCMIDVVGCSVSCCGF